MTCELDDACEDSMSRMVTLHSLVFAAKGTLILPLGHALLHVKCTVC